MSLLGPFSFKAPEVVRSQVVRLSANNSSDLEEWEEAGILFHFQRSFFNPFKRDIYCSFLVTDIKHIHKNEMQKTLGRYTIIMR